MNREEIYPSHRSTRFAAALALSVFALLFATEARAGCMNPGKTGSVPIAFLSTQANVPPNSQDGQDVPQPATIVGLWHVIYTATYTTSGPLPVPVAPPDFEFAETMKTWHADGTEWEEKIEPPPAGFCFGVWKHAAGGSEKLHHFGAVTAPDGSVVAVFYEDELNRVAPDGKSYSGTFDFKLYGPTDVLGTGPVLQEIRGTTAATRIAVD